MEAVQAIRAKFSSRVSGSAPAAEERSQLDPLMPQPDGSLSQAEIERLEPYIVALNNALYVSQIDETRAIQVSFTHTDPVIAATVANGVAQVFLDESYANKAGKVDSSTCWLDKT